MVKGLELFKDHFRNFGDSYVLIGGVACDLLLSEAGLTARQTKDLDIVLRVGSLEEDFEETLWNFILDGKYQHKKKSTGENQYYRFEEPQTADYPAQLELFSRVPDSILVDKFAHLTPIPTEEDISNLSAIILSDEYYQFLHEGIMNLDGLSIVRSEYLIPLKAKAWLSNTERKESGQFVKDEDITKHKNDVFRLFQLLSSDDVVELPGSIKDDLKEFFSQMEEQDIDFKNLGLRDMDLNSVQVKIRDIYDLE